MLNIDAHSFKLKSEIALHCQTRDRSVAKQRCLGCLRMPHSQTSTSTPPNVQNSISFSFDEKLPKRRPVSRLNLTPFKQANVSANCVHQLQTTISHRINKIMQCNRIRLSQSTQANASGVRSTSVVVPRLNRTCHEHSPPHKTRRSVFILKPLGGLAKRGDTSKPSKTSLEGEKATRCSETIDPDLNKALCSFLFLKGGGDKQSGEVYRGSHFPNVGYALLFIIRHVMRDMMQQTVTHRHNFTQPECFLFW